MRLNLLLLLLSIIFFVAFTLFSYSVATEVWQTLDFDTTVKLQDKIPRKFDEFFSLFSLLGSAEITVGLALLLSVLSIIKLRIWAFLGWLMIIPASFFEVFGKLFVFHPGPPVLFHRTIVETHLPSFYIHTNFSYPSGHTTRTLFLLTVFVILSIVLIRSFLVRFLLLGFLASLAFMMLLTRIYLGEHWLSDVLGGGILGMSTGLFAAMFIIQKR